MYNSGSSIQTPTSTLCSLEEEEEEDEIVNGELKETCSFNSQLSKTLPQILADKGALGYFIQFMETRNSLALIKFWLEVECLCSSFDVSEIKMRNVECADCVESTNKLSNSIDSNENFHCDVTDGNVNDCKRKEALFVEYVNSNDTESKCNDIPKTSRAVSGVRQSSHGRVNKGLTTITQDVLKIYKRYIAKDTLGTNQVPEDLKGRMKAVLTCDSIEPMLQCLSAVQKIVYQILENE